MALDGQGPRIFGRVNRHNVRTSHGTQQVLNIRLIFVGVGPIYVLSNVGYLVSFIPVLLGYHFSGVAAGDPPALQAPEWFKYVAVLLAVLHLIAWGPGIVSCAIEGCQLGEGKMVLIGLGVVLLYFPL